MKKSNDKPAPIYLDTSAEKSANGKMMVTTKLTVTDDVDDFWFESNESKQPYLDYNVSEDKKTITLKEYPGNTVPPQLIFYFNTDSKISYNKDFELNIVFPEITKEVYDHHHKALHVHGLRCKKKLYEEDPKVFEQETEKGIIIFPDIKPKL